MLPKKNALTEKWKQKFVIFALLFLIAMGCEWLLSAFFGLSLPIYVHM